MRRLALLTLVAFVVVALVVVWRGDRNASRAEANQAAARQACVASNQTRKAVADVFEFMRALVVANGEPQTEREKEQTRMFFDGVAARLKPVLCE